MKQMTLQWIAATAIALASAIASSGCSKSDSATPAQPAAESKASGGGGGGAKPLVGVSLLTLTNPFFKEIADTLQSEAIKSGYEVVIVSGDQDPAKQKDQVKDFIVRKASAIILTPCDSKSIGTAIAEANGANIPVFTADIAATAEGAKVVSHVATDNLEGGRVAGRAVVEALGGKGKVAIINHPEVESGLMREKGFLEVLATAPGIQVVAKLPSGGARDKAFSAAQDILQSHSDLDAIFAINDPSALGALAALEKAAKTGVKVIGFDGQLEARQAVKDGKLYATVMQYPNRIAASTVQAIGKYLAGEEVKPIELIPPGIYRADEAKSDSALK